MNVLDRFLRYVKYNTQADENTGVTPSTEGQMNFARVLKKELEELGLTEISLDENGYLMATLESNTDKNVPTIGFISHLDTSPDMSGQNVNPRIVKAYDGTDIVLNAEQNIVLSPCHFPELLSHQGEDLVVTDGTTLLGADDKAGIAEIISAIEYLKIHPQIKHGKIRIAFNPDEEIGLGAHKFDVERFGAQWAYTMDGGDIGELEYENFNAAAASFQIQGRNVHPGYAKDKMINALLVANAIVNALPSDQTPAHTSGYEGFFHLISIEGSVDRAKVSYIIRDHDREKFENRKEMIRTVADQIKQQYSGADIVLTIKDQYYNMKEQVAPVQHIVDWAFEAMKDCGITPIVKPIRGGTDGAQLSFKGLPCPNIFAGGLNFHGRYEFISVRSMEKAVELIVRLAQLTAEKY